MVVYHCTLHSLVMYYTLIKKKTKFFLIYKVIQMRSVAKSYMRKGFLIYEEKRKYLTIYEEAVSHFCTSLLNFFIYEENLISFFSVLIFTDYLPPFYLFLVTGIVPAGVPAVPPHQLSQTSPVSLTHLQRSTSRDEYFVILYMRWHLQFFVS